jgi:hypothetical protein
LKDDVLDNVFSLSVKENYSEKEEYFEEFDLNADYY